MAAEHDLLAQALSFASDTSILRIGRGVLSETAPVFTASFPTRPAIVVADQNTFSKVGQAVHDELRHAGVICREPFVFDDPDLYAEDRFVERLRASLADDSAIAIAVGSGTINDLTKLASHRAYRPYMVVATAASMDGYSAFGASVTSEGSKQTFECPAPRAVIADLDVISAAPRQMNAWGYADLMAKITAGADWIIADELGIEPIHLKAWRLVQENLRAWLSDPAGIRSGSFDAIENLTTGLLMSGFAIQAARSSRAASGAEHQFSHLWDMQHHMHEGKAASHGAKVGVATIAVARFYERLLELPLDQIDVEALCAGWPDIDAAERQIGELFDLPALYETAKRETRAKYVTGELLRSQLQLLKSRWPTLSERLRRQLLSSSEMSQMLADAGAVNSGEQIGITDGRLVKSFHQAYYIRRRFTVLDLAKRSGVFEDCVASATQNRTD